MGIISFLVFIILQIAFIPLAIVGAVLVGYKQMVISKRLEVSQTGIDTRHVTFLEVDFSKESAFEKLEAAGYDPAQKTLFLWEGVTLYLTEADVRKILQDIKAKAAPGSVVLADFYAERFLKIGKGKVGKKAMEYTNEGLGFGFSFESGFEDILKDFIVSEGVKQGDSYFMGTSNAKGPFVVVAELCV